MSLKKVETFLKICMTVVQMGITLIDGLEIKIKNNDDTNRCMYKIISTCNHLSYLYNQLPNDSNGIILREKYNLILKQNLENKICFILNNNDNTKNVNCFSFYETNLKKSAVNSELLRKVQKQNGGMGIIYTAVVAGIAAITMLSDSSQVEANTFNKNKFVENEKALNVNPSYELNYFNNNHVWGICSQNAYIAENSMGGICTDAEWKAADPNGITWITENYKWTMDPDLMNGNTQNLTFGVTTQFLYGEFFTNVPSNDRNNLDWFRNHFKEGEKTPEAVASKATGADVAVTTISTGGHAMNMMYDRNTKKICVIDGNKGAMWNPLKQDFVHGMEQYTCEPGFFSQSELNDIGTGRVIYSNNPLNTQYGPIILIRQSDKIFKHDNNMNTGTTKDLIKMHHDMRECIVDAQKDNINNFRNIGIELPQNFDINLYKEAVDVVSDAMMNPQPFPIMASNVFAMRNRINNAARNNNTNTNTNTNNTNDNNNDNVFNIGATAAATAGVAATAAALTDSKINKIQPQDPGFFPDSQKPKYDSWLNWLKNKPTKEWMNRGGKKTIKKFSKKNKKSVVKKNKKNKSK